MICDYGFARLAEDMNEGSKRDFTKVGTPYYMSPQILEKDEYGYKCDVYSLGIILFETLYGTVPYTKNINTI
jgi:serine/threonine protein kinase